MITRSQAFTVGNGSSVATLQLLGDGLHTFANGLVINENLQGNGTVSGNLTVSSGGFGYPGGSTSIGRLVLRNSPSLNGNGNFIWMDVSKNGTTLTNDQIQVTAPLTCGGTLTVSNVGPTALGAGDSFQLFTAASYSGAFATTNLPARAAGLKWSTPLTNGTLTVVTSAPPAISSVTVSGTNLVFNVTGGSPGGTYASLTSTNVELPLSSWTTNSTGNFDWMGNLTLTNATNPATPQHFFTVRAP